MVGYFWGITFAFYTRADSRAALPCQPCFSPPPLIGSHPCQQPGSCPQEEKNRRIYISLTLPRLSDSSLLLAPAGPFKWTAFRVEWGGGGGDAREGWSSAGMNGPGKEPFPVWLMTFWPACNTGSWLWISNPCASNEDNVNVWPCQSAWPAPFFPSQHILLLVMHETDHSSLPNVRCLFQFN